jgi:PPOX class probable F420-dependent enzyme
LIVMSEDVLPDAATPFGRRVRQRLHDELIIWMVTVGADGTPQPNPVWFLWDGDNGSTAADEFVIYSRADAHRITHIRERPNVAFNFDGNGRGGDIVVFRGIVTPDESLPACADWPAYVEKYGPNMERVSGSIPKFAQEYPVPLRVKITNVRGH